MADDPTTPNANRDIAKALGPAIAVMVEFSETQIKAATTPLLARITGLEAMVTEQATRLAELEAQIAKLTGEARP
jgi:cell division protein FtsL